VKKLIEFFARQGLFSELFTVLVLGIGLYSLLTIKKEVFPNVQYDIITVYTAFPGAAPSEVEKLITNPLEQELKEVDGIKKMTSTSIESLSGIIIQLDPDQTTQEEAKADVQEIVDRFKDLPEEAEDPEVAALESKVFPVVEVTLWGGKDLFSLKEAARYVEEEIENISGVARVDVRGEREYEIRVEISAKQLRRNQISFSEVIGALREQNISIPGGTFKRAEKGIEKDVIIRTEGQFRNAEDVKKTVVRANDLGHPILLGDVANVFMDLKEAGRSYRVNGQPAIRLVAMKKENADAIDMIDGIKKILPGMTPAPGLKQKFCEMIGGDHCAPDDSKYKLNPNRIEGVQFELVNDLSKLIRRRVGVLSNNLVVGLILVVLVLSVFLPFRVALVTAIGIPFSFLGTMTFFDLQDVSLNLITMMGLIIVIGMLVDDAVVVTENAVREMEDGEDPMSGAIKGTQKIWAAVFASVMTTVLAFFPMTIMSGIFGKFVSFIPIGVICALIISLLECYFVLPYHIGRWVTLQNLEKKEKGFRARFDIFWNGVLSLYGRVLHFSAKMRWLVLLIFFVVIGLSIANVAANMRVVLFPPEGIDQFLITAKAPKGSSLEQTTELLKPLEKIVEALPDEELLNFVTTVGEQRQREDEMGQMGTHYGQVMIYLTPESARERIAAEIIEDLRGRIQGLPDLEVYVKKINPGPPVGNPINVGVQGKNYDEIMKLVAEIEELVKSIEGTKDVTNNYSEGKEQMVVRVRPADARSVGLSANSVGQTVLAAFEGVVATSIRELDDEIDIRVSLPEAERNSVSEIGSLEILNPFGQLIRLSSIAELTREKGVESISHENNARQVTISGDVDVDVVSATEVSDAIRAKEAEYLAKYPNLSLSFGGEDQDTQESLESLKRAFFLALILIYFLLILTFQSFVWPIIIILVIPIGAVSVTWALFLHGQPLSFMGMLGVVALAGVIVNNAIVFVDFVMKEREKGTSQRRSIIEAGKKRLRPIVLTTLTTVSGILPTAYGIGGLDPFVVPIAIALGWGMLIGSIFSSFFLPAFVSIFDDFNYLLGKLSSKKS
jgi:multidrug efflux pump subunit AcrB